MEFTEREKARIVAKYIRTGSVTTTQHWVNPRTQKTPPLQNTIIHWYNLSMENGNLSHKRGSGRHRISYVTVEQVRFMFGNQPCLIVRAASTLQVSLTTVHLILRGWALFAPIQNTKFPWPSQQRRS